MDKTSYNENPEQIYKEYLSAIPAECREIGTSYFKCIEEKLKENRNKNLTLEQVENLALKEFVPYCNAKYNVDLCVKENQSKKMTNTNTSNN